MTDVTIMWRDPRDRDEESSFAFQIRNRVRADLLPASRRPIAEIAAAIGFRPHRRLVGIYVSDEADADVNLVDAMRAAGWDPENHGWIQNNLT